MIARARQAREQASTMKSSSSSSSGTDDDSSTSSSEDEPMKPVFVPKHSRVTEIERERKAEQAEEAKRVFEMENEQYLQQQRERAVAEATKEEVNEDDFSDRLKPPPIGDEDTEEAYRKWKIRELKRIMRLNGIKVDEEEQVEENHAGPVKGAFYRDMIVKEVNISDLPEREQIASATSRMKSTLFKQATIAETEEPKTEAPKAPSAALTERLRIAQKFAKRSGGMKDL